MNAHTVNLVVYIFFCGLSCFVLLIGYAFGKKNEQKHLASLANKEQNLKNRVRVLQIKQVPFPERYSNVRLVTGSVVIANDTFKKFLARWRGFLGGEMKSYHGLLSRARREAIVRVQEKALSHGANTVINIRFETSSISKGAKNALHSVEVLAYGTALIPNVEGSSDDMSQI